LNPLKKLLGQTAIYGLSSIVGRLLNYFLVPLYTYVLCTAEYGIVTEMYAYVGFFLIFLTYGMETGFFRFAQNNDKKKLYDSSLTSLFVTSFIFIILIFFFYKPIANLIGHEEVPQYVLWLGIIVALDAFSAIPFAKLRQENKAKRFASIKVINICVNIFFNLFFIVLCPYLFENSQNTWVIESHLNEPWVGYIFVSNLIASIITIILLLPEILQFSFNIDIKLLKRLLIYSSPLLIAGLAGNANEMLDRILLKYLLPENIAMSELGIYGANYKVAIFMTLFIQMFRYAAEPFFFNQEKDKNSKKLYADVMKYFVLFGLLIFLGIMMYIDVVKHFIGPEFRSGLKIVPILLLANLFLGIVFNLSIWYKLNNLTKYGAYLAVFGATITVALNAWWIPIYGYMGSAWATLICYFAIMIASYFLGRKYFKIDYNIKLISAYLIFAIALYYISTLVGFDNNILKYLFNTFILFVFLAVVIYKEKLYKLLFNGNSINRKDIKL